MKWLCDIYKRRRTLTVAAILILTTVLVQGVPSSWPTYSEILLETSRSSNTEHSNSGHHGAHATMESHHEGMKSFVGEERVKLLNDVDLTVNASGNFVTAKWEPHCSGSVTLLIDGLEASDVGKVKWYTPVGSRESGTFNRAVVQTLLSPGMHFITFICCQDQHVCNVGVSHLFNRQSCPQSDDIEVIISSSALIESLQSNNAKVASPRTQTVTTALTLFETLRLLTQNSPSLLRQRRLSLMGFFPLDPAASTTEDTYGKFKLVVRIVESVMKDAYALANSIAQASLSVEHSSDQQSSHTHMSHEHYPTIHSVFFAATGTGAASIASSDFVSTSIASLKSVLLAPNMPPEEPGGPRHDVTVICHNNSKLVVSDIPTQGAIIFLPPSIGEYDTEDQESRRYLEITLSLSGMLLRSERPSQISVTAYATTGGKFGGSFLFHRNMKGGTMLLQIFDGINTIAVDATDSTGKELCEPIRVDFAIVDMPVFLYLVESERYWVPPPAFDSGQSTYIVLVYGDEQLPTYDDETQPRSSNGTHGHDHGHGHRDTNYIVLPSVSPEARTSALVTAAQALEERSGILYTYWIFTSATTSLTISSDASSHTGRTFDDLTDIDSAAMFLQDTLLEWMPAVAAPLYIAPSSSATSSTTTEDHTHPVDAGARVRFDGFTAIHRSAVPVVLYGALDSSAPSGHDGLATALAILRYRESSMTFNCLQAIAKETHIVWEGTDLHPVSDVQQDAVDWELVLGWLTVGVRSDDQKDFVDDIRILANVADCHWAKPLGRPTVTFAASIDSIQHPVTSRVETCHPAFIHMPAHPKALLQKLQMRSSCTDTQIYQVAVSGTIADLQKRWRQLSDNITFTMKGTETVTRTNGRDTIQRQDMTQRFPLETAHLRASSGGYHGVGGGSHEGGGLWRCYDTPGWGSAARCQYTRALCLEPAPTQHGGYTLVVLDDERAGETLHVGSAHRMLFADKPSSAFSMGANDALPYDTAWRGRFENHAYANNTNVEWLDGMTALPALDQPKNLWHASYILMDAVSFQQSDGTGHYHNPFDRIFMWRIKNESIPWVESLLSVVYDKQPIELSQNAQDFPSKSYCLEHAMIAGPNWTLFPNAWDRHAFRRRMERVFGNDVWGPSIGNMGKIVFLTRGQALLKRNILNEDAVIQQLRSIGGRYGYSMQVAQPDKLTFLAQVRLFAQATVLVTAHGSAETNIVFMTPGTHLIEFQPAFFSDTIVRNVGAGIGVNVHYLKATMNNTAFSNDFENRYGNYSPRQCDNHLDCHLAACSSNFTVDLVDLSRLMVESIL